MTVPAPAPAPTPTPAPAPSPAPAPAPAPGATGYVNPDGTFAENWHSREEFKEIPNLSRFKDLPTLAKSYRELELRLSQNPRTGVVVPGPEATEMQHAEYRKAMGIPDTPAGYTLKPDKLPDGIAWDETRGAKMAEVFHKNGVSQAQAAAIIADYLAGEQEQHLALRTKADNLMAERERELQREWGNEYGQKMNTIKQVVATLGFDAGDPELFNNGKVLSFLGKVTGMLSEDAIGSLRGAVGPGGTFISGAEEARAITRDPNHPEHAKYLKGDPDVVAKVRRLYNGG